MKGSKRLSSTSPTASSVQLKEIGERLRAYRMGCGLSPEELAARLNLSRAALYRVEKGQIPKIETLLSIAAVLDVSLASLLGAGVEYIDTAVAFFERMRQLEENSEQIIGLFGPVSYLLTSDTYDTMLGEVLRDNLPEGERERAETLRALDTLMEVLRARKHWYQTRRPLIVSLISMADLERFLLHGALGRHDLPAAVIARRREQAREETRWIEQMLRDPKPGVQIGIVEEPTPATTFQIFRRREHSTLAISPFRLGEQPNVRLGVAMITSAPEPMQLHEAIARRLWEKALKGEAAADRLASVIARYAVGNGKVSELQSQF